MTLTPIVAILDDEPRLCEVLAMVLRRAGHQVQTYGRPQDCLDALERDGFDLLLTDLKMPGMDGVEVTRRARALQPELPVVLLTAYATVQTAVAAMKEGACDYLTKPIDNEVCRAAVARALEQTRLTRQNRHLRAQVRSEQGLDGLVAHSDAMIQALDLARRAARSRSTVLITGQSGTGKEVIARAIHVHSDRVGESFIAVNCKALAAGVLESELFGHARGAFSGATQAHRGIFERAHGGTVFLDEIGEIEPDFQAKLLRVLQHGEISPVGGQTRAVDVRVVAATNRELPQEVKAGRFREDLFFRLAVIPIRLAPLRERRADVLPLARAFLVRMNEAQGRRLGGWSEDVERWMLAHDWPGNVRELENTLERGVVLARGDRIELSDLVLEPRGAYGVGASPTLQEHLDAAAIDRIRQALRESGGVRVEAARQLGVERTTLYRLMKRYGITEG
ncbi:MAG: sigma-54 dependent transcriptional regulator [Myxococcota bacterium]